MNVNRMSVLLSKTEGLIDQQYLLGDDTFLHIFGASWHAQTFTPTLSHQITTVRLLLGKEGSPGIMTVSIRATTGGKPTGADLATGTRDLDALPLLEWSATNGIFIDFDMGAGAALTTGVVYAIVVRTAGADTDNDGQWHADLGGGYAAGTHNSSADSGVAWTITAADALFKEGTQ